MNPLNPIDQATAIQRDSADPTSSVVLKASAGSGKTKVLVDRFLRLCIQDNPGPVNPRSILAITFTKKAAVEIQERLLKSARELALATDDELAAILEKLLDRKPTAREEIQARRLFEIILEDFSGLNVSTIHSFCQLILGRFAAEAGLDPHFSVLEDSTDLREEALDLLDEEISTIPELNQAAKLLDKDPDGVRRQLIDGLGQTMRLHRWLSTHVPANNGDQILPGWQREELLPHLLRDLRHFLFPKMNWNEEIPLFDFLPIMHNSLERFLNQGLHQVEAEMGADLQKGMAKVTQKLRDTGLPLLNDLKTMIDDYSGTEESDPRYPARSRSCHKLLDDIGKILLTGKGETKVYSREKKLGHGEIYNRLVVTQGLGIIEVLELVNLLELYGTNKALLTLLMRLLDLVDELKRRDRVIDFQDLEDMACRLMSDEGRALSLMHRLDDSLNHILLDEFQDTNYNQWDMLSPFVHEFLSGGGKTVFVVGDVKQSIYGFRAAEPELFKSAEKLMESMGQKVRTLPTNFRSLPEIVDSVGCTFNQPPLAGFYSDEEKKSAWQKCARGNSKGAAVVLPVYETEEEDTETDRRNGDELAADAAARLVRHLVDTQVQTEVGFGDHSETRNLNWGDILVLCRTRTEIGIYEKAFREFKIPIVPAGRGMLAASREIQDVLALLRWLAYPDDDIALATVLRSPIFRYSEELFQKLLAKRELMRKAPQGNYLPPFGLWPTLRQLQEDAEFGSSATRLNKWRKHVGRENSHDLLRRIFREGQLLQKYEDSKDSQVGRNLVRLFDLALSQEVAGTPTVRQMSAVIERAARRGSEEEAAMPEEGNQGRVSFMTIHGAKGLEKPVVLLVDADRAKTDRNKVLRVYPEQPSSPLLFKALNKYTQGKTLRFGVEKDPHPIELASRQGSRRQDVENANLLYVAMTRARDQLFILGSDCERGKEHTSMYRQVQQATEAGQCSTVSLEDPSWLSRPPWPRGGLAEDSKIVNSVDTLAMAESEVREWDVPVLSTLYKIETPSSVDSKSQDKRPLTSGKSDSTASNEARRQAMERGNRVHLLLQLAADGGQLPPGQGPDYSEAEAVLANPKLEWIFKPGTVNGRGLSETPAIHRVNDESGNSSKQEIRITGTIDRLIIRKDRVDVIDYKTNRTGGQVEKLTDLVEHYRPQMESYRQVVESLFPGRKVRTWLLFTDPDLLDQPAVAGVLKEVQVS
ncbi:MAG: UvrD-helicase domain-containing protein [bacterium]|nr:UvrD-helicase domain-containing protein [bacterium]